MFPLTRSRGRNRFFGANKAWTPAALGPSVVSMWFDAADAATLTLSGSSVSQWDDKSGNSRHAVQAVAASQPTYIASDALLNNKPAVNVPVDAGFIGLQAPSASYREVWCVGYYGVGTETLATNTNTILSGPGAFDYERIIMLINTATLLPYGAGSNFTGTVYKNGSTTGTNVLLPLPVTMMRFRRDSGVDVTQATNLQYAALSGGRNFRGSIAEWVFISGDLSTSDRQLLEGYLAWKWGGF